MKNLEYLASTLEYLAANTEDLWGKSRRRRWVGGILGGGIQEERPALPAILEFQEARGVHSLTETGNNRTAGQQCK